MGLHLIHCARSTGECFLEIQSPSVEDDPTVSACPDSQIKVSRQDQRGASDVFAR